MSIKVKVLLLKFVETSFKFIIISQLINKIKHFIRNYKWCNDRFGKSPPRKFKQKLVKMYARRFSINILIETGTFMGEMVLATRKSFKNIFSIEIYDKLYNILKKRCSKYKNISLFHGNSVDILPKILSNINNPCLFWLDAHYCGEGPHILSGRGELETPIVKELQIILNSSNLNHVILIDDARLFVGKNDYPTLEEVRNLILSKHKDWIVIVKEDCIRSHKMFIK